MGLDKDGTAFWVGRYSGSVVKWNCNEGGRNGFDGIESLWKVVPGSELP